MSTPQEASPQWRVAVTRQRIDPAALHRQVADPAAGCTLSFVGTVRDNKEGRTVLGIDYECYEPMAERVLLRIAEDAARRWTIRRLVIEHRIGRLQIGDASVAIVVSTPHRAEGFEALRFVIETLKRDVPVWKKEHFEDGAVWVQEGP